MEKLQFTQNLEEIQPKVDDKKINEEKINLRHESVEKTWQEYIDKPYPKFLKDFINSYGKENSELNDILNEIVSAVLEIRARLLKVNRDLKHVSKDNEELKAVLAEILNQSRQERVHGGQLGKMIEQFYLLGFYYSPQKNTKHIILEHLSRYIEFISKPQVSREIQFRHFQKSGRMLKSGYIPDFKYGSIFRDGLFYILENYFSSAGSDIVYCAPKSALFSAQIIKGAIEYASEFNDDITVPYFAFPKSKIFKIFYTLFYSKSEDQKKKDQWRLSFVKYLDNPDNKNKKSIEEELSKFEGDKPDTKLVIEVIEDLNNVVERMVHVGKKEIRISPYDEIVNTGSSRSALKGIIGIVSEHIKHKYDVDITMTIIPPIETSTAGRPEMPSFYKVYDYRNNKVYNKEFQRISKDDQPTEHALAVLGNSVAELIGYHYGYEYEVSHRLVKLKENRVV